MQVARAGYGEQRWGSMSKAEKKAAVDAVIDTSWTLPEHQRGGDRPPFAIRLRMKSHMVGG